MTPIAIAVLAAALLASACADGGPGELRAAVEPDGRVFVEGRARSWDELEDLLAAHADRDRVPHCPHGSSRSAVAVVSAPRAPWLSVRRALQVLTAPRVRITRARAGLTDGPLRPVTIDVDRIAAAAGENVRIEERPRITVVLLPGSAGEWEVKLLDSRLGGGEAALEQVERRVRRILGTETGAGLPAEIDAPAEADFGEVAALWDRLVRAGVREVGLRDLPPVSWELCRELHRLEDEPGEVGSELAGLLWHTDPRVRDGALDALARHPVQALGAVLAEMERRGPFPGEVVLVVPGAGLGEDAEVLAFLGADQAPVLARALAEGGARVRVAAAAALSLLRDPSGPPLEALRRAREDPDEGVRTAASRAVRRIESRRREADGPR